MQDSMTIASNLVLTKGTLDTNVSNSLGIFLAGNWTTSPGATLKIRNSTITFNGSGSQILNNANQFFGILIDSNTAGSLTFASSFTATSLTVNGNALSSAMSLFFNAGSSATISALNLTGYNPGNPITLRSTTNGSPWKLRNLISETVSYVDVEDSNAGPPGNTIYASNSKDSTGNTNWNFGQFIWTGGKHSHW